VFLALVPFTLPTTANSILNYNLKSFKSKLTEYLDFFGKDWPILVATKPIGYNAQIVARNNIRSDIREIDKSRIVCTTCPISFGGSTRGQTDGVA
jgi:hypothetical protein